MEAQQAIKGYRKKSDYFDLNALEFNFVKTKGISGCRYR